jgi:hypothetical protein
MGYLFLQALASLLGSAVAYRDETSDTFFLIRIVKQLLYIIISPMWHFIVLMTYMPLIKKFAEYEKLIQKEKE